MAFQRKKPAAIGVKASFPGFVEPALASSIERVPRGERWIHEIKFDGYRVQLHIANDDVKVFTRRRNDWTRRFREWVEKPADSPLTIPAYLHDAVMQLPPEDRLNRVKVNEAVRLADPDAQR